MTKGSREPPRDRASGRNGRSGTPSHDEPVAEGRREYQELFDAAPDPFLVTDANGVLREVNHSAHDAFPKLRRGQPLVLAVTRADRPAFYRFLAGDVAAGSRSMLSLEAAQGQVQVDIHCRAIGEGRLLWLLRDVTETEEARRQAKVLADRDRDIAHQLREIDELRRSFLLTVSHDLRTPLAAIAGLADTLGDTRDLPEADRERVIEQIRRLARRVVELFTDLMDLERLESADLALRRMRINVDEVVTRVADRVDLGERALVIDTPPLPADLDRLLLERIVENLLRNESQHTPTGTTVWVRTSREPDGILLVVEDDGPGIPNDLAPRIFELFQRERRPGARDGLGVGLTLVKRFAELHGGYARLEHRRGGGACFHVLLTES